jgi:hypothetical protein
VERKGTQQEMEERAWWRMEAGEKGRDAASELARMAASGAC